MVSVDNRIHWDSLSRKGFIKDNRQLAESSDSRRNTAYLGWASRNESPEAQHRLVTNGSAASALIRKLQERPPKFMAPDP